MSSTALSTESIISIAAVVWAVALPFLPSQVHHALRHPLAAFVLLALVLGALRFGPIPGVLVLLAVLLTFVERNRVTIKNSLLEKAAGEEVTYQKQLQASLPMDPNEVHPLPTLPATEEIDFMPNDEIGSNEFEPVAQSQDEKNVIPTISSTPEVAERYFLSQGLASTKLAGDP
jgi:hypothetical protein